MGKQETGNARYQHLLQTIDRLTGEIVKVRPLEPGGRNRREEGDVQFLHPRTKRLSVVTGKGGKRAWDRLKGLKDEELGRLMRLVPLVGPDNRLERKGRWLTGKDLAEELGIHRVTVMTFLKRCEEAGVMARGADGGIYVNPLVMAGCEYLPLVVYGLFREDLREFLPADVVEEYEGRLKGERS